MELGARTTASKTAGELIQYGERLRAEKSGFDSRQGKISFLRHRVHSGSGNTKPYFQSLTRDVCQLYLCFLHGMVLRHNYNLNLPLLLFFDSKRI